MEMIKGVHPGIFIHSVYIDKELDDDRKAGFVRTSSDVHEASLNVRIHSWDGLTPRLTLRRNSSMLYLNFREGLMLWAFLKVRLGVTLGIRLLLMSLCSNRRSISASIRSEIQLPPGKQPDYLWLATYGYL